MKKLNEKILKERIEENARADIQSGRVGGMSAVVTQNGETIYQGCFGDERIGIKVSEDTIFRLASMTKPVTAVAALILVEQGKLELDTPIYKFMPEFRELNIGRVCGNEFEIIS
ncbi:MAG: beta-lactamase family protein, partial [Roseburia sp.]|nr:beta-lactamase family protein [Roseburia sp.]